MASFYALFSLEERPPLVVHVCDDLACRCAGAEALCQELEECFGPPGRADSGAAWQRSPCLGCCEGAPAAFAQRAGDRPSRAETLLPEVEAASLLAVLAGGAWPEPTPRPLPQAGDASLRLLRRIGAADPESLDSYRAAGGYRALRAGLELGPEGVIREVAESRLLGRGGAAFPTGRKWEAVARNPVRPHYLVCNADESEPGTFKDRVLMEEDPFAVVEAMTLAGLATGCELGFLYVRGEYPLARRRIEGAAVQARARGLLGDDILGRGLRFDIEVRRGAGAYVCGEETALFNSIEGRRGEPRNKPPFPVQAGLFGRPTVVNNVETLVNVLDVVTGSGTAFAATGTPGSTGTRLFCVSGRVARPGLYEVPFGATLRALLALAGGPLGRLRAVLLGGAAGSFLGPDQLDLPLTFEATREVGASLGSGVVIAFDETSDLPGTVVRIARFFREESCGQCVPCRVGTVRQEELLHRMVAGPRGSREAELALLEDLARVMRDASICGLGQTAATAVTSAVRLGLLDGAGVGR